MKKYVLDLLLRRTSQPRPGYVLLQLTDPVNPLPPMQPGQFVEVRVDGSPSTFLRRPISINLVDREANELWLLVHAVGEGTRALARLQEGATLNVILPLGRGFTLPAESTRSLNPSAALERTDGCAAHYLLVGGGVGTAPLLYMGQQVVALGCRVTFLLGGRTSSDLMQLDLFRRFGTVNLTTEDGSVGEKGFVTQHSLWNGCCPDPAGTSATTPSSHVSAEAAVDSSSSFTRICTCGPKPMMMAVARLAREKGLPCEASLENLMACGLGACLCCVEDTVDGHLCVCQEGPVFDTTRLKW